MANKKQPPMRRISRCFKCKELKRSLKMHRMFFTGKMDVNGREIDVVDEEVLLCDTCFVDVGYYLKRAEEDDTTDSDEELLPLLQVGEQSTG